MAQVAGQGNARKVVFQHRPGVAEDDLVVVDVGDVRPRAEGVRDLMSVLVGGESRADVEELEDALFPDQEAYRAGEELPVIVRGALSVCGHCPDRVCGLAVWPEVVLSVSQGVVYPGHVRFPGVEGSHVLFP